MYPISISTHSTPSINHNTSISTVARGHCTAYEFCIIIIFTSIIIWLINSFLMIDMLPNVTPPIKHYSHTFSAPIHHVNTTLTHPTHHINTDDSITTAQEKFKCTNPNQCQDIITTPSSPSSSYASYATIDSHTDLLKHVDALRSLYIVYHYDAGGCTGFAMEAHHYVVTLFHLLNNTHTSSHNRFAIMSPTIGVLAYHHTTSIHSIIYITLIQYNGIIQFTY